MIYIHITLKAKICILFNIVTWRSPAQFTSGKDGGYLQNILLICVRSNFGAGSTSEIDSWIMLLISTKFGAFIIKCTIFTKICT